MTIAAFIAPIALSLALAGCARGDDLDRTRALFAGSAIDPQTATDLGFTVTRDRDGVTLSDRDGGCSSRGVYRVRSGGGSPVAITAPHGTSDRGTRALASALFEDGFGAAAAWNSAPRLTTSQCPGFDLARAGDHAFTAFALGFSDRFPDGLVVQLHGFDGDRRESAGAADAAMIVSDASRTPSARILDIADCLSAALAPRTVLVFPVETGELGALQNAQAEALHAKGHSGFAHLELSLDLREALLDDGLLRAGFGKCISGEAA